MDGWGWVRGWAGDFVFLLLLHCCCLSVKQGPRLFLSSFPSFFSLPNPTQNKSVKDFPSLCVFGWWPVRRPPPPPFLFLTRVLSRCWCRTNHTASHRPPSLPTLSLKMCSYRYACICICVREKGPDGTCQVGRSHFLFWLFSLDPHDNCLLPALSPPSLSLHVCVCITLLSQDPLLFESEMMMH